MDSNAFMGLLIGSLVVLVGFIVAIITPIIKLNTTITKLNDKLDFVIEDKEAQKKRITEHGREIDDLNKTTIEHGVVIDRHERRIGELEKLHERKTVD